MVYLGGEADLRRFVGVVGRKIDREEEDTSRRGRVALLYTAGQLSTE